MASDDSDVFYVEQSSIEPSPQRHNRPNILNSIEISEQHTAHMISISSIASLEPQIVTIDDDSNEPTMPYVFSFCASASDNELIEDFWKVFF